MTELSHRETTSPSFQDTFASFEVECSAYQEAQRRFLEITSETKRLTAVAEALEAEAEASNAQWKKLAQEKQVDQRKVNSEIERSIEARQKAQTIRMTAEARGELGKISVLALAEARFELTKSAVSINATDLEQRLENLMANEDFRIAARSAYSICEAQCFAAIKAVERPTAPMDFREVESDAWRKFSTLLRRVVAESGRPSASTLALVPPAVPGEIIATSFGGLNRLKKTGGVMPGPDGYGRDFQLKQV